MKNYIIIGKMGSGKDTLASFFSQEYKQLAFGNLLKIIVSDIRKIGGIHCAQQLRGLTTIPMIDLMKKFDYLYKTIPYSPPKDRKMLQILGTWCRQRDDLIWIRPLLNHINHEKIKNYIITDCRRQIELDSFPKAIPIFIEADEKNREERLRKRDLQFDIHSLTHISELGIDKLKEKCKIIIENNSTIEKLKEQFNEKIT